MKESIREALRMVALAHDVFNMGTQETWKYCQPLSLTSRWNKQEIMDSRSVLHRVLQIIKRLGLCVLLFIAVLAGATTIAVWVSGDDEFAYSRPQTLINDITQMNPTYVGRVVEPTSIDEVVNALRTSSGPVSIGGGRFSQGGQVSYPDSLHLDMRKLNRVVNLDVEHKRITVESGITWRRVRAGQDRDVRGHLRQSDPDLSAAEPARLRITGARVAHSRLDLSRG